MPGSVSTGSWRRVLACAFGGLVCVLAVGASWAGLPWYQAFVVFCAGFVIILGRRRIFRPGVSRESGEIVCRYIPWYEGNVYFLNLLLPLIGVAMVATGLSPGNPVWFRFGGIVLVVLTPLFTSSAVRMWRRSSLRISPSELTLRVAASKSDSTEILRERVESLSPKIVPNGVGGEWLQVEIAFRQTDSDEIETVLLGLQLTVRPIDLVNGLLTWRDGAADDPGELLDRVEGILRGHTMADV